jgi:hypothetical protein
MRLRLRLGFGSRASGADGFFLALHARNERLSTDE